MPDHIYLYGVSGSGKTTTSKILAKSLGLPRYDLDEEIEKTTGETIESIFNNHGETKFREQESKLLAQISTHRSAVIALGGGALLSPTNRKIAESTGTVICLNASLESLQKRLSLSETRRPLISDDLLSKLPELLENRKEHYESFKYILNTSYLEPEEAGWQTEILIGRFRISSMGSASDIRIQFALLQNIDQVISTSQLTRTIPIITDNHVAILYGNSLIENLKQSNGDSRLIVIPAGEKSKNIAQLTKLWSEMLIAGTDRKSTLIAIGGGVVGDLAGYAAASFMRGIPWINIPTSLLAQIDAGIGAKTGINLDQGKNLVGAFHPPRMIVIDPIVLKTLPPEEISNGFAEIIKHGVIGDPALFRMSQGEDSLRDDHLEEFIRRAAAVKIKIVSADPYEQNLRQALNFGHTIGHAVEKKLEYKMKHGEAVSVGMVAETYIAERIGLAEKDLHLEIGQLLESKKLPTKIPENLETQRILESIYYDKKRDRGKVLFALPEKIGSVKFGVEVDNLDQLITEFRES